MNNAKTLYWSPEEVLTKALRFLGHENASVSDSGMKVVIELETGEKTFFLYPPFTSSQEMIGHVVEWLMSFEE